MVPVTEGPSVAVIRSGLVKATAVESIAAPHILAFRSWVLNETDPLPALAEAAAESFASTDRAARHVAVLGYAATANRLAPLLRPVFEEGVHWLAARRWNRPFQAPTLEADGVSMLGLALGIDVSRRAPGADTLARLSVESARQASLSAFNRSLMAVAAHRLDVPDRPDLATLLPEVRVALSSLGVVPDDPVCGPLAWTNAMRHMPGDGGPAHAALTLRAFDALCERNMPARLGRLEANDVVRVLKGVGHAMRSWTWEDKPRTPNSPKTRWDVENEYHVQNLLWTVLAPLFADLNAEEYAPPVGQKNPRMDLTIPSMRLVVEVKFVRAGASFAKVVEEIAADAALYKVDPKWQVLIPFIWDDSRRSEDHPKLVEGLRKLDMVHDAVVLSRPGKMGKDPGGGARGPKAAGARRGRCTGVV